MSDASMHPFVQDNPPCGTLRNTLALIRSGGEAPGMAE
jgi:hypothetical protein